MLASGRIVGSFSGVLLREFLHLSSSTSSVRSLTHSSSTLAIWSVTTFGGRALRHTSGLGGFQSRNFGHSADSSSSDGASKYTSTNAGGSGDRKDKVKGEKLGDSRKPVSHERTDQKKLTHEQQQEHEEFVTASGGGKPNLDNMWKFVPDDTHDRASTDTGGYIKLEDSGMDLDQVDAVHRKDNSVDSRLKAAKDPVGPLGGKTDKAGALKFTPSQRGDRDRERQKDHQINTEVGQEDSKKRRIVSNAQQSVVWENAPRSTSGGAQSSPEAGGIEHLTEQLMDREAAAGKQSSLETEKDVTRQELQPKEKKKKPKAKKDDSSSSSDSDSDDDKVKKDKKKKK